MEGGESSRIRDAAPDATHSASFRSDILKFALSAAVLGYSAKLICSHIRRRRGGCPPPMPSECNDTFHSMRNTTPFLVLADRLRWRMVPVQSRVVLYCLYKQATVGDAPHTFENSAHTFFATALADYGKWDAWRRLRGMSQEQARELYVNLANEVLPPDDRHNLIVETQALAIY